MSSLNIESSWIEYDSFGNKSAYATINSSSIGQYAMTKDISAFEANEGVIMEELIKRVFNSCIKLLGLVNPSLKCCITHLFNVANELKATIGDINIKHNNNSDNGIWKTVF